MPSPVVVCDADSGIVGNAKQADLHTGDALTGRAFHQYFEIGCEGRCRAQQHERATREQWSRRRTLDMTLSFTRERGW